jgi:hypothetical protein
MIPLNVRVAPFCLKASPKLGVSFALGEEVGMEEELGALLLEETGVLLLEETTLVVGVEEAVGELLKGLDPLELDELVSVLEEGVETFVEAASPNLQPLKRRAKVTTTEKKSVFLFMSWPPKTDSAPQESEVTPFRSLSKSEKEKNTP